MKYLNLSENRIRTSRMILHEGSDQESDNGGRGLTEVFRL